MNARTGIFVIVILLCLSLPASVVSSNPGSAGPGTTSSIPPASALPSPVPVSGKVQVLNPQPDPVNDHRDFLVVSKNPEFYSYTLTGITILLTVMTILLGATTGIGLTVVLKVNKERRELESIRKTIEAEKQELQKSLKQDYEALVEAMRKTAYGLATLQHAKDEISRLLDAGGEKAGLYKEIEKTIPYPDDSCIRLYGQVLEKHENDLDMIRLVRNGLLQFKR